MNKNELISSFYYSNNKSKYYFYRLKSKFLKLKGRILALDYGKKRTGLAVTDELQICANPLDTILTKDLYEWLIDYLNNEKVEALVIGLSEHKDGVENSIENDIQNLINRLRKKYKDLPIEREDESFTSQQAKEIMLASGMKKKKRREKANVDKISAILILQRYLGHI